jgi:hypothetical protein
VLGTMWRSILKPPPQDLIFVSRQQHSMFVSISNGSTYDHSFPVEYPSRPLSGNSDLFAHARSICSYFRLQIRPRSDRAGSLTWHSVLMVRCAAKRPRNNRIFKCPKEADSPPLEDSLDRPSLFGLVRKIRFSFRRSIRNDNEHRSWSESYMMKPQTFDHPP